MNDPFNLYASFGCEGVARYDVTNPLAPTLAEAFYFEPPSAPPEEQNTSLKIWPAAVPGYVYVSLLGDGIGILKVGEFANGWRQGSPFRSTYDANAFLNPPAAPNGDARVLVADGRGGLVELNIPMEYFQ